MKNKELNKINPTLQKKRTPTLTLHTTLLIKANEDLHKLLFLRHTKRTKFLSITPPKEFTVHFMTTQLTYSSEGLRTYRYHHTCYHHRLQWSSNFTRTHTVTHEPSRLQYYPTHQSGGPVIHRERPFCSTPPSSTQTRTRNDWSSSWVHRVRYPNSVPDESQDPGCTTELPSSLRPTHLDMTCSDVSPGDYNPRS